MTKRNKSQPSIAFLVIAHNHFDQLALFTRQLLRYSGSHVYLHIRKGVNIPKDVLPKSPRMHIIDERVAIEWGDITLVEAVINLMKNAANSPISFDYISLHSGTDLAIKPVRDYIKHLEFSRSEAFIECNKMPIQGWGRGGGLERIALRYPAIYRARVGRFHPYRLSRIAYQKLYQKNIISGKQLPKNRTFYGGSLWFTISGSLLRETLQFIDKNPRYTKLFSASLLSDEIYFNTIFVALSRNKNIVTNNNLRFINWSNIAKSESGSPKVLDINDLYQLTHCDAFFARKFDDTFDKKIIDIMGKN